MHNQFLRTAKSPPPRPPPLRQPPKPPPNAHLLHGFQLGPHALDLHLQLVHEYLLVLVHLQGHVQSGYQVLQLCQLYVRFIWKTDHWSSGSGCKKCRKQLQTATKACGAGMILSPRKKCNPAKCQRSHAIPKVVVLVIFFKKFGSSNTPATFEIRQQNKRKKDRYPIPSIYMPPAYCM